MVDGLMLVCEQGLQQDKSKPTALDLKSLKVPVCFGGNSVWPPAGNEGKIKVLQMNGNVLLPHWGWWNENWSADCPSLHVVHNSSPWQPSSAEVLVVEKHHKEASTRSFTFQTNMVYLNMLCW
ncbi:hypothetical protein SETIT_9G514900v2 [Setaria italica]|uniref:Uncharacterized protein n=2 Tax=Setaria italica TaxID=4555 RepID=A0A368SUZ5_SETIT|nr:hypothetical protein SETIT_9G514900v2 [Setaria italica]